MVPITLKLLLPVFRYLYGIFITYDVNFVDAASNNRANAYSMNITENLGALDVIVSDKTGTLTRNKLSLLSLTVEDRQYGMTKQAPSLVEDEHLNDDFKERQSDDFRLIFQALSVCHSIRISAEQKLIGSSADETAILKALKRLGWRWDSPTPDTMAISSPLGSYHIRILRVNPFDRERMLMSVVARVNDDTYVFMKGASERVVRRCTSHSGPLAGNFHEFERIGLRAMGVSCRLLEDYDPDAPTAELENDHRLLGSLGIEDELQQDVQLTMDLLSDAGLKMWVATGDAKTNTIVIASMLRLIRQGEQVVHLSTGHLREEGPFARPGSELYGFSEAAAAAAPNSFSTLVNCEESDTLNAALENKAFVEGLYRGRCVIFYRCKPVTKAQVAVALQNLGRRVLGIGDGANDSVLLSTADVGIGILGRNGQRSFAGCDFAVPAFRNLGRLILVHGHLALHRSVLAVNFSFYKAALFGVCQIVFQIWTDCTGQSFFDPSSLTAYNNVWTLIPLISLLFEKDISENFLYKMSFLYTKLRNPLSVHPSNLPWFFSAVYQGVMTMAVAYILTGESFLTPQGKDYGQGYLSLLVYTALVFNCAFYMAYQTNTFTYYSLILIVGNLLLLISLTACLQTDNAISQLVGPNWTGFFGQCLNSPESIVFLLTMVLAAVTPAWVGLAVWAEFFASESLLVIENETTAAKEDRPLFFDPPKKR
jgi:phospholipid-translocating ATPase